MENIIEKVKRFNSIGGLQVQENFLNKDLLKLKIGLIQEELNELTEAAEHNDPVEVLDAGGDLLYVLVGLLITYNLDNVIVEAFNRIHDSNMSKFCLSEADAKKSVNNYYHIGVEAYYKKIDDLYVIFRTSDNKILKGIDYLPVNLQDLCTK